MKSEHEILDGIGQRRYTADELRTLIANRGWQYGNLALWLGVTRIHLARVIKDVHRARHWELALANLPQLTQQDSAVLTSLRLRKKCEANTSPATPRMTESEASTVYTGPGYRYRDLLVVGSIVVVVASHVGEMAEEGEEGEVIAIRDTGSREDYLIRFSGGEDWFDPDSFDACMAETGKSV